MSRRINLIELGLSENEIDHDAMLDAYEDRVFELTNFFMRRAFLPKLARAKIERLKSLEAIACGLDLQLTDNGSKREFDENSEVDGDTLKALVLSYNKLESQLKQILVATPDAGEAIRLYGVWISLFEAYAAAFVRIYEESPFALPADPSVKLSEQVHATELIAEINDLAGSTATLHKAYSRFKKILT